MSDLVVLDAGPLGMLAHPHPNAAIADWFNELAQAGVKIVVPEIADYEVRRELIRARLVNSIRRLDRLKQTIAYLPLSTSMMMHAAELWAAARQAGTPTAPDAALDSDVILAARALSLVGSRFEIVVATDNVGHIARFAFAKRWQDIAP